MKFYDRGKGYGFIVAHKCPSDVFFLRVDLPPELQDHPKLSSLEVSFDFSIVDGKPRANFIVPVDGAAIPEPPPRRRRDWSPPPLQRREPRPVMPPPVPPPHWSQNEWRGVINSFDPNKSFGFISCPDIQGCDVFFHGHLLPPDVQPRRKDSLTGVHVAFELGENASGKPRAERMWFLNAPREKDKAIAPEPLPLDAEMIRSMMQFIEEQGGTMDYGKFANAFPRVKKVQLEPHFTLSPLDQSEGGGRWQISLVDDTNPEAVRRIPGTLRSFDPNKSYGFLSSPTVSGDIYFARTELPLEFQDAKRGELTGLEVQFVLRFTADGKPRGEQIDVVEPSTNANGEYPKASKQRKQPFAEESQQEVRPGDWNCPNCSDLQFARNTACRRCGTAKPDGAVAPEEVTVDPDELQPIEDAQLSAMMDLLDEAGGAMCFKKFANSFRGVTRQQVEPYFTLVQEGDSPKGRWQITLPGVEPITLPPEEKRPPVILPQVPKAAPAAVERRVATPETPELVLAPSPTMRLVGTIQRYTASKGYGFVIVDGLEEVFMHRAEMPPELRGWKGEDLAGMEVTLELGEKDGKPRALAVHALLRLDEEGQWQLRRS